MIRYRVNEVKEFTNHNTEKLIDEILKTTPKHSQKKLFRLVPTRDGCGIIFISCQGDIYPSGFLPIKLGNIKTNNVVKVYREHNLLRKIRKLEVKGKCSICEFKFICGGSRARAYSILNDVLGEDPACIYKPKQFQQFLLKYQRKVLDMT